jgi:hypothetical protein
VSFTKNSQNSQQLVNEYLIYWIATIFRNLNLIYFLSKFLNYMTEIADFIAVYFFRVEMNENQQKF